MSRRDPVPPPPVECDAYFGALGSRVPGNHLPPPHKLTRTQREQIARDYLGVGYNLVKGPLAYDTAKQLERGHGMRSDTNVYGYLRAPKLVVPAVTAPQLLGSVSVVRPERTWLHGGTFGARPIPMRTSLPGRSDTTKNKLQSENPWTSSLGFAKHQLASNPYWININ